MADNELAALNSSERFELISLDPYSRRRLATKPTSPASQPTDFHGYAVLGRTVIADPATRWTLNDAFAEGAAHPWAVKAGTLVHVMALD